VARTLRVPEYLQADGDIVILARRLVYSGPRAAIIAPLRSVSVFIVDSEVHEGADTDVSSTSAPEGSRIRGTPKALHEGWPLAD
jgi:hypothetical protein